MISLIDHSINANISDRYATIEYCYNFENKSNYSGSTELKFEITIDPESFISHFIADIDGEMFYGKTKEKEEAKEEYKEAKEKNENAILISKPYKDISNVFQIKTNIDKDSKVSLQITIEQYLTKKFNFNQLNVQILRNFEKYNIKPIFEYITFKLDISDKSGIFDIKVPSSNTSSNTSLSNNNDIIIDNKTMNKTSTECCISGKIHFEDSSINELILKYKIKGEQNDSIIVYDSKSRTFCHVISDIISDSMMEQDFVKNTKEGDGNMEIDKIVRNILIQRRVMFVIDKSGSMAGSKWNKTRSATIIALQQLRINFDRFGVIFFNDSIQLLSDKIMIANQDNINNCIHKLQNENAGGSTNINDALIRAIQLIQHDIVEMDGGDIDIDNNFYMNQIIFITDGEPNRGERDTKTIISNVKKANDLSNIDKYSKKISIFSFGVGKDGNDSGWINDLNHSFLKLLSLNNNGIYKRIKQTNIDTALTEYYDILSKPVLTNINIKYDGNINIKNLTKTSFNALYSGNDLIICGQLPFGKEVINEDTKCDDDDDDQITATISAITGKEVEGDKTLAINISKKLKINLDSNENNKNIERIWAYLKLQQFAEEELRYDDMIEIDEDEEKEKESLPLSLAMKYKFVTPWTSMIVVKKKKRIFEELDGEYGELLTGIKEHKMKLVTIGDANCGKSSLILRFVENIFDEKNNEVSMNINCKNKKLKINNSYFNISLWDTVGQERYSSNLAPMYLRNANGIIFVCDINNVQSIENIKKWAKSINQTINFNKNNAVLIVNKSDLINNNDDDNQAMKMVKDLTNKLGINYVITSAKNNINVQDSFYKLIESIYDTMFANNLTPQQNKQESNEYGIDQLMSTSANLSYNSSSFHHHHRRSAANINYASVDLCSASYSQKSKKSGCC